MSFQREEFFGPGRTSARARRKGWQSVAVGVVVGLLTLTMWFWAPDDRGGDQRFGPDDIVFMLSPLLALLVLASSAILARRSFQVAAQPEAEALWYALDDQGLHLLHDVDPPRVIAWTAMRRPIVAPGAVPRVKLPHRPVGAAIDRTLDVQGGQRTRGGALFEDRLLQWYDAHGHGALAGDSGGEAATASQATPPNAVLAAWREMSAPKRAVLVAAAPLTLALLLAGRLDRQDAASAQPPVAGAPAVGTPVADAALQPVAYAAPRPPTRLSVAPALLGPPPEANHEAAFRYVKSGAALGFREPGGDIEGALACRPSDDAPVTILRRLQVAGPLTLGNHDGYYTVNDRRVSKSLGLRIDGRTFSATGVGIEKRTGAALALFGELKMSQELRAALRDARFIELVSGDEVLSITTAFAKPQLAALADRCAVLSS